MGPKIICVMLISIASSVMPAAGEAAAGEAAAGDNAMNIVARNESSKLVLIDDSEQKIVQATVRNERAKANGVIAPGDKKLPLTSLEEIQVFGTSEPRAQEKSPIQKLRDTLDKGAAERKDHVTETPANDGARYAQVKIGGKIYCIEERRGQIDIAGHVDVSGLVPRPSLTSPTGRRCRTGQY